MLQQVNLLLVCHRTGKDRDCFLSCKPILESAITSNRQQLDVSLPVFYSTVTVYYVSMTVACSMSGDISLIWYSVMVPPHLVFLYF